jgi:hypothetical protein
MTDAGMQIDFSEEHAINVRPSMRLRLDLEANDKWTRKEQPHKNFRLRYSANVEMRIDFRLEQQKNASNSILITRDSDSKQTVVTDKAKQLFLKN